MAFNRGHFKVGYATGRLKIRMATLQSSVGSSLLSIGSEKSKLPRAAGLLRFM